MHIISKKVLEAFWLIHPEAHSPLDVWHQIVCKTSFENFMDMKKTFNTADYAAPFTIFDVGGNNFRVITAIHYNRQMLFIRNVFTHREYDKWCKAYRSGKI